MARPPRVSAVLSLTPAGTTSSSLAAAQRTVPAICQRSSKDLLLGEEIRHFMWPPAHFCIHENRALSTTSDAMRESAALG